MKTKIFELMKDIYRISISLQGNFEFNHFLIIDESPVLVHTGRVVWFRELKGEISKILNVEKLKYIVFSHFEADECGALNDWLQIAPSAIPLTNQIGRASVEDFSVRSPKIVRDGDVISLGKHDLLVVETPHFPHNWDAMLYFELKEGILFSSDLGAHAGVGEFFAEENSIIEEVVKFQRATGFMPRGPSLTKGIEKIEKLPIHYLATQHGSTLKGESIKILLERLKIDFGF